MRPLLIILCAVLVLALSIQSTAAQRTTRWRAVRQVPNQRLHYNGAANDDVGMLAVNMMTLGCQSDSPSLTLPNLAANTGLTELVTLVQNADLASTLSAPGTFTLFGPTNQAISSIPEWLRNYISNQRYLSKLLTYHVLANEVKSTSLRDELLAATVNGKSLRVNLYPKRQRNFRVATVQCVPIDLGRVDEEASNGVLHVISKVMIPPYGPAATTFSVCPIFSILTSALRAARLYNTLNGPGPYTVFAPTDEAFRRLPAGTLDRLLRNTTALTELLTYHVVSGTYCSAGLESGPVTTLNSKDVRVYVSSGGVMVNGARVTQADGSVTNGVAHVIDQVLIPPGFRV